MKSQRLTPKVSDFYSIRHSPIQRKSLKQPGFSAPIPESCPRPYSSQCEVLPVPSTEEFSFRSLSSRADHSKLSPDPRRTSQSPYSSPQMKAQSMERIIMIEQQIKKEKERYKTLERRYKELMAAQTHSQERFENIVQELQRQIAEIKGEGVTPGELVESVKEVRQQIGSIGKRFEVILAILGN